METVVYNQKGKEQGKISLPESVFGLPWNSDLVHQVFVSMQSNARTPVAHAKDRSAVSGGGIKPWRQKGTGRARHGSNRSPIWIGGGVTHGPINEKNYKKKINRKVRAKALYTVLSEKLRNNEIIFVDTISLSQPKTKDAKEIMQSLGSISGFEGITTKKKNTAYIALSEKNDSVEKSFQNFGNIQVNDIKNINPVNILNYKYLVITNPQDSISFITGKMNKADKEAKK